MKYKKYSYIIVLMLILVVGINPVLARRKPAVSESTTTNDGINTKMCYYMSEDGNFKATLKISWGYSGFFNTPWFVSDYADVSVDKVGENSYTFNSEGIANWWQDWNAWDNCITDDSVCFEARYQNRSEANDINSSHECPNYLVFQDCSNYWVWATDSQTLASNAQTQIRQNNCNGFYASYKNKSGNPIDSEEYYSEFVEEGIVEYDENDEPTCADYEALFGDKEDPESIRYMLDTLLQYVRIIVPILIILLGTLDFAKAVLAGKEDNMKKAQTAFIKRVLIGVAVFFVPVIVDIVMYLADIVWAGEYIHCDL